MLSYILEILLILKYAMPKKLVNLLFDTYYSFNLTILLSKNGWILCISKLRRFDKYPLVSDIIGYYYETNTFWGFIVK